MNIQCPKCQFPQPKDQYCAQCGIDISRYKSSSSIKLKSLLINSSIPIGLLIIAATLTYKNQSNCPPLCESASTLSVATKKTINFKKLAATTNNQKTIQKNKQTVKQKTKTPRAVSSIQTIIPRQADSPAKPKGLDFKKKKINLTIEAQLVRFSKSLTALVQESSSLKALSINDDHLKNTILENTEVLNDFDEQNIKKTLNTLTPLSLSSKGLQLIVLNGHLAQPSKNTKLFFEILNLDLESLQSNIDPQSLVAILINVH